MVGGIAFILAVSAISAPPAAATPDSLPPLSTSLGEARDFVGTWEYHWGDFAAKGALRGTAALGPAAGHPTRDDSTAWQSLGTQAIPRPPGRQGSRFLWLRTPLKGPDVEAPTLYIGPLNQIFEAFVDGTLVYRFGTLDGEGREARRFLGYPMHLIPLPGDYQGRMLTLRIYSQHIMIGPAATLRIGSKARLVRDTMIQDLGKVVVGSVLCAIGLFVLGLYLSERKERAYLYYAGFAFTMGVWLLCQTRSRHLLLSVPLLWTHLEYFALYTAAVFMALFLGRVLGRGLFGLMPVVAGIFIAYDVSMAVLVSAGVVPIMQTLALFEFGLLPILAYFLMSIGALLRQGSSEARLFAAGFMVAMTLAAYDVMAAIGLLPRAPFSLANLGQGGFVVALGLILVRQFRRVHRDLLGTKQELSEKLQALQVRAAEIENLNVELRHQIQARSSLIVTSLSEDNGNSQELARILPAGALLNDRYRVLRIVGQGAMGVVYEVERVHDGRHFAAKVLSGRHHRKELARFAREAQLLARLKHENLVSIADIDINASRQAYIVMEFVAGTTLADQSARYGELGFVLPVLRQLAGALAVVHAEGIVHRDLKPANILISRPAAGEAAVIKVADFGISALLSDAADSAIGPLPELPGAARPEQKMTRLAETVDDTGQPAPVSAVGPVLAEAAVEVARGVASAEVLTQTGVIMGTPLYMAPELIRGARLARPASDIFSFGVIAFELLTGRLPSEVPPMMMPLTRAGRWHPALAIYCPDLPEHLGSLFERCLEVTPESRPTAVELAALLTGVAVACPVRRPGLRLPGRCLPRRDPASARPDPSKPHCAGTR